MPIWSNLALYDRICRVQHLESIPTIGRIGGRETCGRLQLARTQVRRAALPLRLRQRSIHGKPFRCLETQDDCAVANQQQGVIAEVSLRPLAESGTRQSPLQVLQNANNGSAPTRDTEIWENISPKLPKLDSDIQRRF